MTLPLFPDTDNEQRAARLRAIFQAWLESRARSASTRRNERPFRPESAKVYQEMWHAFATFCAARGLALADIEEDDLQTFLVIRGTGSDPDKPRATTKGDELSPRYAWRMLALIDAVARFDAKRAGTAPNPAARELRQRPEYRYVNATHADPLPEYYGEAQAKRLIAYLTEIGNQHAPQGPLPWKEVRNRTALALMLGGGLSPGDVRALTLGGIHTEGGRKLNFPWKLSLPGNGNSPARETPLAQWAGRQLAFWLTVRAEQRIEGELVFPSTRSGKPWTHTPCYKACKEVLAKAGMGSDSGGVFKLRHTFALRQLAKGRSESDVARWLGLLDLNGMARYRRIVSRHIDIA